MDYSKDGLFKAFCTAKFYTTQIIEGGWVINGITCIFTQNDLRNWVSQEITQTYGRVEQKETYYDM